jgi:hypothetical protein
MAIFRQYIAPLLIVLTFLVALLAVSSRIFLPSDMAAPAPVEGITLLRPDLSGQGGQSEALAGLPPSLSTLVKGLPSEATSSQKL